MSIEEKYIEIFLKDLLIGCTGSQLQHAISLLQSTDCLVVAHRLSCPVACGILVPQPGIKPMSPALQGRVLTIGPPVKFLWGSILKDQVRERSCRVCDQLVHSSLTG